MMAIFLRRMLGAVGWVILSGLSQSAFAQAGLVAPGTAASAAMRTEAPLTMGRHWMVVPRMAGHLTAKDLGVVINTDDPYSVEVGEYYIRARDLAPSQVLRLKVPVKSVMDRGEFEAMSAKIDAFFGDRVQALALAWRRPYAVDCNAITGALSMGYDADLCKSTCARSRQSRYFGSAMTRPWQAIRMRLSMLLAAPTADLAKAMIDRGVSSDGTVGGTGQPPVQVHLVTTSDAVRSVRERLFPPAGPVPSMGLNVHLDRTDALQNASKVLVYLTGRSQVDHLDSVGFVPGALADHLTSFGGALDNPLGQMSILQWIEWGATASYGTTSEPCAHLQKFPHPQVLLLFYTQGLTAIEAYWKSVAWPQQGLFIGEPLAAPFDRSRAPPLVGLRR